MAIRVRRLRGIAFGLLLSALPVLLLSTLAGMPAARAGDLAGPTGPVILTVSGAITRGNGGGEARFDRELLAGIGWLEIVSHTPWTNGPQRFGGIRLADLLAAVGARGTTLVARALNDYSAAIAVEDAGHFDVLLALDRNGVPMPVRDRGPIWIVYPESQPQDEIGQHNDKMVWQLRSIEVR
jgi:hypothetical protein